MNRSWASSGAALLTDENRGTVAVPSLLNSDASRVQQLCHGPEESAQPRRSMHMKASQARQMSLWPGYERASV